MINLKEIKARHEAATKSNFKTKPVCDALNVIPALCDEVERLTAALKEISNVETLCLKRGIGYDEIVDCISKIALGIKP